MFARVAAESSPALAYAAPPCVGSPAHSGRTIAAAERVEALLCRHLTGRTPRAACALCISYRDSPEVSLRLQECMRR